MNDQAPTPWNEIRRITDELELKIHLASMEARDRWNQLRPRVIELETAIERAGKSTKTAITQQVTAVGKALRQLRGEIADQLDPPRPSL